MSAPTAEPFGMWERAFSACAPKRSNSEDGVDWDTLVPAILTSGATKPGYSASGLPEWSSDEIEALWTTHGGIHYFFDANAVRRFTNITWLLHGTPWQITQQDDLVTPNPAEMRDLMDFVVSDHAHADEVKSAVGHGDFDAVLAVFPARLVEYARRKAARTNELANRIRTREGKATAEALQNAGILRSLAWPDPEMVAYAWTGGIGDIANAGERETAWELANYATAFIARRANPDAVVAPEPEAPRTLATAIHDAILEEMTGRGKQSTVAMELVAERATARATKLITAAA